MFDLDPRLYQPIYIIAMTIFTLVCTTRYNSFLPSRIIRNTIESVYPSLILMAILIVWIGFRPISGAFVDMRNYNEVYVVYAKYGGSFHFDWHAQNLFFDNLFNYLSRNKYAITIFFIAMSAVYFGCMWLAIRRWFKADTFYAFVIYLSAFSTFSYGTNGIKAGAAASIFLLALSYRDKRKLSICLALVSWFFHHSMYMVIAAYIATMFVKNPKYYLWFWVLCVLCAAAQFNPLKSLMTDLSDSTGVHYLQNTNTNWGGKTGFRIDFLIYGLVPIAIGWYMIFKQRIRDAEYTQMFNLYLLCNALWVLCMYIPFNNRIAYLSWFMLPIVSIYPYLRFKLPFNQYKWLNIVAWTYLLFTLIMAFIL